MPASPLWTRLRGAPNGALLAGFRRGFRGFWGLRLHAQALVALELHQPALRAPRFAHIRCLADMYLDARCVARFRKPGGVGRGALHY